MLNFTSAYTKISGGTHPRISPLGYATEQWSVINALVGFPENLKQIKDEFLKGIVDLLKWSVLSTAHALK